MRFLRALDDPVIRGYSLIAAVVFTMAGAVLTLNVFPTTVRQIAGIALLGATAFSLFVVYAPLFEGQLITRRQRRAELVWHNTTTAFPTAHSNLFWTYLDLPEEMHAWSADNCAGRVGVLPVKSGLRLDAITKTIWFETPDDALHFKMRWR